MLAGRARQRPCVIKVSDDGALSRHPDDESEGIMSDTLTLYYDGACPFCIASTQRLREWDVRQRLRFVDISASGFEPRDLGITMEDLRRELYGVTDTGAVVVGTSAILAAYTAAGVGWRVLPLRTPILRSVLAFCYRVFARNRYAMSRLLGYHAPTCTDGVCELPRGPAAKGRS